MPGLCDKELLLDSRWVRRRIDIVTVVRRREGDIVRSWWGARGEPHRRRAASVVVGAKADASGCLACVSDGVQVGVGGHRGGSGSGHGGGIVVPTGLGEGEDERIPQVVHRPEGTTKAGIAFTGGFNHTTQEGVDCFKIRILEVKWSF